MGKFFEYDQNNSGGSFWYDDEAGICEKVIIEADSADHADARARGIGIEFGEWESYDDADPDDYYGGGYSDGSCPCCGVRWCSAYGEGDAVPSVYGEPLDDYLAGKYSYSWRSHKVDDPVVVYVHYLDGRVEGFKPTYKG